MLKTNWKMVAVALGTLLISSYLDNIRAPLLPVLTDGLHISYSKSSWFLVSGNFAAVAGALSLLFFLPRFGLRKVGFGIFAYAVGMALTAQLVTGYSTLIFHAVLLGATVSLFGTCCNLFLLEGVDVTHRGRFFCGLHMMYGFGSLVAPALLPRILHRGFAWPVGILITIPYFLLLAFGLAFAGYPKKHQKAPPVPLFRGLKKIHYFAVLLCALYVGGEVMTSMWMVAYLVEAHQQSLDAASPALVKFFLCMGLSRGICFLGIRGKYEVMVMVAALAGAVVFIAMGLSGLHWALPFAGVLGPFFPLLLARISRDFPQENDRLLVWINTLMQLTLGIFNLAMGRLSDWIGISKAYHLPPILISATLFSFILFLFLEHYRPGAREVALSQSGRT